MSTYTSNLHLTLPGWTESYDLDVWNGNSQIIDTFAGQIAGQITALQTAAAGVFGSGTSINAASGSTVDLNTMTTPGRYQATAAASEYITNQPGIGSTPAFALTVRTNGSTEHVRQSIVEDATAEAANRYERIKTSGGWSDWYRFAGEAVT